MTKSKPAVVVVGAGPAGAMAARQLAQAGLSVQIISRERQGRRCPAETLSPRGRTILANASLWERVPRGVAVPCPAVISAWDRPDAICHSFITNPYGCAWHIDRTRFDNWLVSEAKGAGAILVTGTVSKVRRIDNQWMLDLLSPDGETSVAKAYFLVVATGQYGSAVRLGSRDRIDALCLLGGVCDAMPDAGDALVVEAVRDGWWYSAPLSDGRLFAGWITDAKIVARRRHRDVIEAALAQAYHTAARLASVRESYCLGVASSAMTPCAGEGWIAVGDAVLARDPLSGEGLTYALQSGWEGARTILGALQGDGSAWQTASERGATYVARYRHQKALAYKQAQRRWPAEPFWVRRVD